MLALSLVFAASLYLVGLRADRIHAGRAVTEPEMQLWRDDPADRGAVSPTDRPAFSGSVTVPVRYRGLIASEWAAKYRHRTRQLQAARARLKHLKYQFRQLRRSSTTSASAVGLTYWINKQIWAANQIGGHGSDAWPNCPDPFDGGGSWQDTVNCENGGNWLDSPGYYRCGLQFDPMWERKYGRLCP